jgi:hypothetical protein
VLWIIIVARFDIGHDSTLTRTDYSSIIYHVCGGGTTKESGIEPPGHGNLDGRLYHRCISLVEDAAARAAPQAELQERQRILAHHTLAWKTWRRPNPIRFQQCPDGLRAFETLASGGLILRWFLPPTCSIGRQLATEARALV